MFKKLQIIPLALLLAPAISYAGDFSELNNKLESQGIGTTYINGPGVSNKQVIYNIVNGNAILEGDIIIGTIAEANAMAKRQANSGNRTNAVIANWNNFRWTNNLIPYQFDRSATNSVRNFVARSIQHWESKTNIRFVLRTTDNAAQYINFINIVSSVATCSSKIGMVGRQQNVYLDPRCGYGGALHEFGHVVGLWHEQSRADRDTFVTINRANIQPGREFNFDQYISNSTDIGDYDYDSIMHYGRTEFGIWNAETRTYAETITPKEDDANIGQRSGLSKLDIEAILQFYPDNRGAN